MTAQQKQKLMERAGDAAVVEDFCQSIGWADVIRPALLSGIVYRKNILVTKLLGDVTVPQTPEQIAAQAYGLQFVLDLVEKILKEGHTALQTLKQEDYQHTIQQ